ncbi:MAG: hydroxylamine reductase [Gammaproteobacteria bacterium]|nr:hydroxylamine reductase [Gammaproteobacteria bacterium]
MFCYQCEQTAQGTGCTKMGVCGKNPCVASLQDLLIYCLQGLSVIALAARKESINTNAIGPFICEGLFATLTNVDFDEERIAVLINKTIKLRNDLKAKLNNNSESYQWGFDATAFSPADTLEGMIAQGEAHGILDQKANEDINSLRTTLLYGLKGMAAYADHARILGKEEDSVYAYFQEALATMLKPDVSMQAWLALILKCGQMNLKVMALLDAGHNETYGHPAPTQVPLGAKAGKAILISGHDLRDLELLLQQTEGKGIYVYTHGEMLPAHGYPELKKYQHFFGHYGSAWQNQHKEFDAFPGSILMTTNCIQKPKESYKDRIFTTGLVAWPGVKHLEDKNFTPLINKALEADGFAEDVDKDHVMVGFGHHAVLSIADKIIAAVKTGKIRHFFLVGGCDGAKPGRSYYTEFVEQVPDDCIILTLACGKFRFFDKKLGDIDGIPRLLDIGQCNDAYSAIKIALVLAEAFEVGVNELPLSFILSWYEQKAVVILLTLLSLGIKNIRLGPSLPAFLSPNVLNILVEQYNIQPITTPTEDLKSILGK